MRNEASLTIQFKEWAHGRWALRVSRHHMLFGQQTNLGCGWSSWWVQKLRGEHQTIFDDFRWEDCRIVSVSVVQTVPLLGRDYIQVGFASSNLPALCYSISSTIAKTSPRRLLWFLLNKIFCVFVHLSFPLFLVDEVRWHEEESWEQRSSSFFFFFLNFFI